jgi:hypothetical protein
VEEKDKDVQKPATQVPSFKPSCACFNLMVFANLILNTIIVVDDLGIN